MSGKWKPLKQHLLETGGIEKNGTIMRPDCNNDTVYLITNAAKVYVPNNALRPLRIMLSDGKALAMIKNLKVK